jgi:hypothetical protein
MMMKMESTEKDNRPEGLHGKPIVFADIFGAQYYYDLQDFGNYVMV